MIEVGVLQILASTLADTFDHAGILVVFKAALKTTRASSQNCFLSVSVSFQRTLLLSLFRNYYLLLKTRVHNELEYCIKYPYGVGMR